MQAFYILIKLHDYFDRGAITEAKLFIFSSAVF